MDFDFEKRRVQVFIIIAGIVLLSFTAEKCRQMVGEDASSQSGKLTIFNCLDMGSGTVACVVKEGAKLYFYNIRSSHIERSRQLAIESGIADALTQGMAAKDAAKHAQKLGAKAAKLAKRQTKRIMGPIMSSGWDFFETVYYGGTLTEGFLRGSGTLVGVYAGGYLGEERFGRFGYLLGSQFGSWVGGRIGLMVYDVVNGAHFLLQYIQPSESEAFSESEGYGESEAISESESGGYVESETDSETLADENSKVPESSLF